MARVSPPTHDPLAADPVDLENRSYSQLLAEAGAYRDKKLGIVHAMPIGRPFRRGGRWVQQTKVYQVAMSPEEAREKTRQTGDRWDWYSAGSDCPRCSEPIVGWCLGGRKFQVEHDHVTRYDQNVYGLTDVDAPEEDTDEDAAVTQAQPVPVEA